MSTGISISSINRIKELAEEKKYAEALEILDTQNLDKSINPQFLRISGEIFRENKRYYDSRKILLKAHQMSPQGNRIIFELIQLYLELGYFTKAQKYYEQYEFYSSPEDTQKDYVEYVMKKALGSDVKELASILIPILEQMPEDKWNFEAVLLYDKMGRKDKALEESRYILENFKESVYVQPVIDYIDDKLDVDKYFYTYPKEEQQEDTDLFGDLIEQEEKLLEADYLRMYPPEARIMVEAEDKDAVETKPVKEKKEKKVKRKNRKAKEAETLEAENLQADTQESNPEKNSLDGESSPENQPAQAEVNVTDQSAEQEKGDSQENQDEKSLREKQIKEEREAALEKLLSKKIDTDKIKESAKQVAKAVKDIDTAKARSQVKSVAESVKDNVKKATDVLGEAVGTKQTADEPNPEKGKADTGGDEQIVDGIIESVLEPPKKVIGQVVTNEELDALIPDSLEAMSEEEIADIEARRVEEERLELEALEAALQLEEKKKSRGRQNEEADKLPDSETKPDDVEQDSRSDAAGDMDESEREEHFKEAESYSELKEKFLAEFNQDEEQPLDSLGFISVVHSDIDEVMEEQIPDAAGMLRQMIDNKEYYAGEDSTGFESQSSYQEHGFEVEDYDFDAFRTENTGQLVEDNSSTGLNSEVQSPVVEVIYAQEQVVDFDEMVPQEENFIAEDEISDKAAFENTASENQADVDLYGEQDVSETIFVDEEVSPGEEIAAGEEIEDIADRAVTEESVIQEKPEAISRREEMRVKILLSDSMVKMLLDLKESR